MSFHFETLSQDNLFNSGIHNVEPYKHQWMKLLTVTSGISFRFFSNTFIGCRPTNKAAHTNSFTCTTPCVLKIHQVMRSYENLTGRIASQTFRNTCMDEVANAVQCQHTFISPRGYLRILRRCRSSGDQWEGREELLHREYRVQN